MIIYPLNNPVAFSFFNLEIRWYGLIMAFAILSGIVIGYSVFKYKISKEAAEKFIDFIPWTVIIAIIGARFFYCIGAHDFYLQNPKEILLINHGGLSLYGAILFGAVSVFVYSKKYNFKLSEFLDIFALLMPLCQSIGRWGNFINQEAFGVPAEGAIKLFVDMKYRPYGMQDIEYYHPAFLYESALDFLLFLGLICVFLKRKNLKTGTITALYLIGYSSIRIVVESVRIDSVMNILNIPAASLISSGVLLGSIIYLIRIYKKSAE